jgi:hypothetical protein
VHGQWRVQRLTLLSMPSNGGMATVWPAAHASEWLVRQTPGSPRCHATLELCQQPSLHRWSGQPSGMWRQHILPGAMPAILVTARMTQCQRTCGISVHELGQQQSAATPAGRGVRISNSYMQAQASGGMQSLNLARMLHVSICLQAQDGSNPPITFEVLKASGPQQLHWTAAQQSWLASLLNATFEDAVVRRLHAYLTCNCISVDSGCH